MLAFPPKLTLAIKFAGAQAMLVACLFALGLCVSAHPETPPKRVLILVGTPANFAGLSLAAQGAIRRLNEKSPVRLEILVHYLDLPQAPGDRQMRLAAEYLSRRFEDRRLDLVITIGQPASEFLIKFHSQISRDASLVLCCVPSGTSSLPETPGKVVGVMRDPDISKTLELAERLQPAARNLVIVAGAGLFDQRWLETARGQIARRDRKFNTRYLAGLPYDELLREVAKLPRDTIVIHLTSFEDRNGLKQISSEVLKGVLQAAAAPVYSPYATNFGNGLVGGYSAMDDAMGAELADIAINEVIRGAGVSGPAFVGSRAAAYRVDDRQLKRWQFSSDDLPPGTDIAFKTPSLWEEHRNLILFATATFAGLTGIVVFMLYQNARRLRAERLLCESNDRMIFAAASTSSGLWQLEAEDQPMWMTAYARTLFCVEEEENVTWDTLASRVHIEDRSVFLTEMQSALIHRKELEVEFRIVRKDESARSVAAKGRFLGHQAGRNPVLTGVFIDITALKDSERETELQRAEVAHIMRQSVLNELSGSIAHELNQPLTSILSNAEAAQDLLDQREMDRGKIRDILNDIVEEDSRAAEVISRVRRLIKKGDAKREAISVEKLIESTLALLHGEFVKRKIAISVKRFSNLAPIFGDAVQLQQVLVNLLINAMDAMAAVPPAERKIVIGTTSDRNRIRVSIADSGSGIPAEIGGKLLEPFVSTKEHGLGLGLSICETILKSHGSSLLIENNADRGVTAVLDFPVLKVPEVA